MLEDRPSIRKSPRYCEDCGLLFDVNHEAYESQWNESKKL